MRATVIHLAVAFSFSASAIAAPLFQQVPLDVSGLDFQNEFEENGKRSYLYQSGFACGAILIGDVDADQKPDVFLCGGAGKNALYLNQGALKFKKVRRQSAAERWRELGERWCLG